MIDIVAPRKEIPEKLGQILHHLQSYSKLTAA
jgi:hypothetical protein